MMPELMYDKPIVNKSGETIPAYAVVQVDDCEEADGLTFIRVIKPKSEGKIYLINGPRAVSDGARSMAASAFSHLGVLALYEGGTPAKNEEWGPKPGSWKLSKGDEYKGFYIVGDKRTSTALVRVAGVSSGGGPASPSSARHAYVIGEIGRCYQSVVTLPSGEKVRIREYGMGWVVPFEITNPDSSHVSYSPQITEAMVGFARIRNTPILDTGGPPPDSSSWAVQVYNMTLDPIKVGRDIQYKMLDLGGATLPFVDVELCL